MRRALRLSRALSLDVVAGVACGGLLSTYTTRSAMAAPWWIALLAAVWATYTADHLMDAARSPHLRAFRHRLHRRHRRALTVACGASVLLVVGSGLLQRPPVLAFHVALACALLLYLASAQGAVLPRVPKEAAAGLIYALGIWGAPLLMSPAPDRWMVLAFGLHALAAVLNLVAFATFDVDVDAALGARSLPRAWGSRDATAIAVIGGVAALAAGVGAVALGPPRLHAVFAILALTAAVPALLLAARGWFERGGRYRAWGDAAFLLAAVPPVLSRIVR